MNERILKLAEQAGLSEGVFTRHDGVPCDLKGYSMTPEQMEKFAELIVQECIKQVFYTIEDEEEDNISSSIRDRIKNISELNNGDR